MLRDAKVQDYMSTHVVFVSPTTPIRVAQQLMEDKRIRHLLVVQDNKLIGILSSGDLRHAGPSVTTSLSLWEITRLLDQVTVEQAMSRQVMSVNPRTLMTHAATLMSTHHFNSLPVVDNDDQILGIVTDVDLFQLLIDAAKDEPAAPSALTEPLTTGAI